MGDDVYLLPRSLSFDGVKLTFDGVIFAFDGRQTIEDNLTVRKMNINPNEKLSV